MNDERLKELQGLCERATPGPWYANPADEGLILAECGPVIGRAYDDLDQSSGLELTPEQIADIGERAPTNAQFISECRTALPELLREVSDLRAAQRWIPVEERLPERAALVTAYFGHGTMQQCYRSAIDGEFCYCLTGNKCPVVIAWQPLPCPPSSTAQPKEKS
jgi:hypothetical protein